MMPPYRLQYVSKKWRRPNPSPKGVRIPKHDGLRPRQSVDVSARCLRVIKISYFLGRVQRQLRIMLLYCFATMLDKDKYFSEIRFSTYSKLIITGLTALNNTITANIFLSAVRWHSGNIYLRRKLNLQ